MTDIIRALADISDRYDALFVDLWGCVHNGVAAYPDAISALQEFRSAGGKVVLVTNAPRPWRVVAAHLKLLGVPEDTHDAIATSGDSARAAMFMGAVGRKVYHIGAEDETEEFFAPMDLLDDTVKIERVPLAEADGIICTGPEDELADPDVYRGDFLYAKQKGLKLLCANPDIVVDRGETREYCAGALAALYTQMGGESLYFGKPHPPIYDLARRRLAKVAVVDETRILCIGDGIHTDIQGGMGEGLDTLFITGGLASDQFGADPNAPDQTKLDDWLTAAGMTPTYAIPFLR